MSESHQFALLMLLAAAAGLFALLSNRLIERIKVPAPLVLLVAAAIAVEAIPNLHEPPYQVVDRLVTVALVLILFDGGLHIGWSRLRSAAIPIGIVGVVGTFLTVAAAAVFVHVAFGISWYLALLVATAVSPTDPAVVFSVLAGREIAGRSSIILEGESGANDPVGIALMAGLISAGGINVGAVGTIVGNFALQMGVGLVIGVVGARGLLWLMREVPLPGEGLYPLRTLACAAVIYAVATLAHGSGFLAVFVAGIALGDVRAPYKREIERFHSALASLGEIVAFLVLGLTVDLAELTRVQVWVPGVLLALVLAVVIRPVFVGLCLVPARLRRNELAFVLFAGLKGAVPILLGTMILATHAAHAQRLYGIVVVVVIVSVAVQGSLVAPVAGWLGLPMRAVEPEPWSLGVRLGQEPEGVHRCVVGPGAPADGARIADLRDLPEDAWISLVIRENALLPVRGDSQLRAGDQVLVLADPEHHAVLERVFTHAAASAPTRSELDTGDDQIDG
ncbi:MAG: cation:proton antiporter [Jatrophihabitantaceae bacterium]